MVPLATSTAECNYEIKICTRHFSSGQEVGLAMGVVTSKGTRKHFEWSGQEVGLAMGVVTSKGITYAQGEKRLHAS